MIERQPADEPIVRSLLDSVADGAHVGTDVPMTHDGDLWGPGGPRRRLQMGHGTSTLGLKFDFGALPQGLPTQNRDRKKRRQDVCRVRLENDASWPNLAGQG